LQRNRVLGPRPRRKRVVLPRENPAVLDPLRKMLEQAGAEIRKTTGDASNSGDPDLIGCIRGFFLAIETKRPEHGHGPTEQQIQRLNRWRAAGAIAFWTNDAQNGYNHVMNEIMWRLDDIRRRA
jgi:hypothetical protein